MKTIALSISILLLAACSAPPQQQTITTYTTLSEPEYVDVGPEGLSVADSYVRRGEVSLSEGGPVVGEYYSQATIVYHDEANGESARSFFKEIILPDGSIYKMDFVTSTSSQPGGGSAGHMHTGALIGGTGAYAGIRGTYVLEISPSGQTVDVMTYWLGQ